MMTNPQSKILSALLMGLWPDVTPTQGKAFQEMVMPFDLTRATALLKTCRHEENHKFYNPSGLLTALRADEIKGREYQARKNKERIIDWIRHQRYSQESDSDLITDHFARSWASVRDSEAIDVGKQNVRQLIYGHAIMAYEQIGQDLNQAKSNAEICVELCAGEKIRTTDLVISI